MDKSTDLKDLDLTCASRGVWLVKVGNTPHFNLETVIFC